LTLKEGEVIPRLKNQKGTINNKLLINPIQNEGTKVIEKRVKEQLQPRRVFPKSSLSSYFWSVQVLPFGIEYHAISIFVFDQDIWSN